MTVKNVDLWAGVVITFAGLIATFYLIPNYVSAGFGYGLSPRFFPYTCSVAITALGAILVFTRITSSGVTDAMSPLSVKAAGRLLLVAVLLAAGLLVMTIWGYLPGAMLMMAAFMVLMGERRPHWIIPTAVGWPIVLWLLFEKLLETPLPG